MAGPVQKTALGSRKIIYDFGQRGATIIFLFWPAPAESVLFTVQPVGQCSKWGYESDKQTGCGFVQRPSLAENRLRLEWLEHLRLPACSGKLLLVAFMENL